jgi:hypothetical protein
MATYLPLVRIHKVFRLLSAAKEQYCFSNVLAGFGLCGTLLDETTERCNTSPGSDHDDGFRRIRWQLKVRVTHVHWHMDTIVLIARSCNGIVQAMRIGVRVTMLLLLQRQKVVGCDALQDMRRAGLLKRLDDGSN